MRAVGVSPEIVQAVEAYRRAAGDGWSLEDRHEAATALADLVVAAYDAWLLEFDTLTSYQRRLLALSWREHRRAQVIEQRGGQPAGRPFISHGREQTMAALRAHGMVDDSGHLTPGGEVVAQRCWQEAGASDVPG